MVYSASTTIILDNGANSIKIGSQHSSSVRIVPNCIVKSKVERKRVYVGDELSELQDHGGLFFVLPFEKGYLVNWDIEQQVWDKALSPHIENLSSVRLVISDPNYLIPAVEDQSDEIIFEHFGMQAVLKGSASSFAAMQSSSAGRCTLVVDCGFSFSTISAFVDGNPIKDCIIRIDIGGKALTNQLKEWISYRELNVMEETYVVNECKEDSCFVSLDFEKDMANARLRTAENTIRREYVLPDFSTHKRGFLRVPSPTKDDLQILTMNTERFSIPEALFRPSDIGIDQLGIVEAAAEVISRAPMNLRAALVRNIVLVGGCAKFPGFKQRFRRDLSAMLDSTWSIELAPVIDPITHSWETAKNAVNEGVLNDIFVTKSQWEEFGPSICRKRFFNWV